MNLTIMKKRQSQVEQLIDLLVQDFRKGLHLPYDVVTKSCPSKTKNCKERHGDIVITSYNKETGTFHNLYHGVHESTPPHEFDQTENIVKDIIKRNTKKTTTGKKPFLTVKDLKKLVDQRRINKNKIRSIRFTGYEDEKIAMIAKERGMEVSDFIRMRLFSNEVPPVLL